MIYECDQCSKALPPGVTACPNCGETFEDAVPADAEVPKRGFSAASQAAPSEPAPSSLQNHGGSYPWLDAPGTSSVIDSLPATAADLLHVCPHCGQALLPLPQYVQSQTQITQGPYGGSRSMPATITPLALPDAPRFSLGGGSAGGNCLLVVLTAGIWLIVLGAVEIVRWLSIGTATALWAKASKTWRRLLYCGQCQIAFDPLSRSQIPKAGVRKYIGY